MKAFFTLFSILIATTLFAQSLDGSWQLTHENGEMLTKNEVIAIYQDGYFAIASYNHESNKLPNRFIEVKSYDGETPYFFWSRNEYSVAKRKQDEYWLYLINRSEMNKEEYVPIMIQNPFETILRDNEVWDKQIEKYKIELINA